MATHDLDGDFFCLARTVMGQKPGTPTFLQKGSRPVVAREREVAKTEAINALLIRPITILPARVVDPIRPFARGLWNDIRLLLKPEVSVTALRKALATYVHSRSYQIAIARPGSFHHAVNGEPVEPVSDADHLDALEKYEGFKGRADRTRLPPPAPKDRRNPHRETQACAVALRQSQADCDLHA
nr:ProQ/FINO family protein [Ensifer sp. ENS03]